MNDLIGRSRNERKLDGVYNKQRDILIKKLKNEKQEDLVSTLSKRKLNEALPFPEIYQKRKKLQKSENVAESNRYEEDKNKRGLDLYKGIAIILNKHIYAKNKFFKSVNVFINLCLHYLNNENKNVFFFAFGKITKVFGELYLSDNTPNPNNIYAFYKYDELHIKCMISLFDKVINKIIDKKFVILCNKEQDNEQNNGHGHEPLKSDNEKQNKNENEIEIEVNEEGEDGGRDRGKKNEEAMEEAIEEVMEKVMEETVEKKAEKGKDANENAKKDANENAKKDANENAKKDANENAKKEANENAKKDAKEKEEGNKVNNNETKKTVKLSIVEKHFLKMLKIKVYYLIILFKLNDTFIFNKLMVIYKQIFEEIQNNYETYEKMEKGKEQNTLVVAKKEEHIVIPTKRQTKEGTNDEVSLEDELYYVSENWKLPSLYEIYKMKKSAFVKCLSNLLQFINVQWAKTSVEMLVQEVYRKKYIFDKCDQIIIENIQSSIKSHVNKKKTKVDNTHVLSIGETLNPIVDARDEKIVSIHGSHVWSKKQMDH